MDTLRQIRIAEISRFDLDYANERLLELKQRLEELNPVGYAGSFSKETFLEIHLTVDDIYLLEKRISDLLDKQLDEYHAQVPVQAWDKKKACRKLLDATENESIVIPIGKLFNILHSSLWNIPYENKLDVLRNFAVILKSDDYVSLERSKELMDECANYQ
jgi:hypothetical protein